jgi:hypothetical protein
MKRLALIVTILAGVLFAGLFAFAPAPVFADAADEVCKGIGVASSGGCDSGGDLTNLVRRVINIFSIVVGILAVIMIIISGFKFITAGGDSGSITSAKHTLVYAIVGLVVAALAQFIVQFVIKSVTN